jgi:phosphate transport system permease protein
MTLSTLGSSGGGPARSITEGMTKRGLDVRGKAVEALLVFTLGIALLILTILVVDVIQRSWSVWTGNPGDFLTNGLNTSSAALAGVSSAIKGTIVLAIIVAVVAFPLGIACAVYLEEYAGKSGFAQWTRVNVRNLAGVPSVVYGLLGLGIFVKVLNTVGEEPADDLQASSFVPFRWLGNFFDWIGGNDGRNIFAAGLALSALVLPVVVITASEALRAVPRAIREGALGVGATQWETIRHHVLPAAAPGILTGTVLSLARATGEAAPILIVGATTGTLITGNQNFIEQLSGAFTALPVAIFSYARIPGADFRATTAAAAFVLVVLVLLMNGFAIWLRNRYERKW